MNKFIFENEIFYIEKEDSNIPWIKIFPKKEYKELSECDKNTREILIKIMLIVEKTMIEFYHPEKINIAMFGNYLPKLHIHIMARFKEDSYFPESMWGKKQREDHLNLPSFDEFKKILLEKLK